MIRRWPMPLRRRPLTTTSIRPHRSSGRLHPGHPDTRKERACFQLDVPKAAANVRGCSSASRPAAMRFRTLGVRSREMCDESSPNRSGPLVQAWRTNSQGVRPRRVLSRRAWLSASMQRARTVGAFGSRVGRAWSRLRIFTSTWAKPLPSGGRAVVACRPGIPRSRASMAPSRRMMPPSRSAPRGDRRTSGCSSGAPRPHRRESGRAGS